MKTIRFTAADAAGRYRIGDVATFDDTTADAYVTAVVGVEVTSSPSGSAVPFNTAIQAIEITTPVAVSVSRTHAAVTLGSGATTVTTAITNPDVPRNVTVKGNASGIAGDVVVTGTNCIGTVITETIALSGSSEVVGSKAFNTVTSILLPAKTNGSGDTVSIGVGAKLGIGRVMTRNSIVATYLNNVREATAPTVAISSTLHSNTIILNSTLDGTTVRFEYVP